MKTLSILTVALLLGLSGTVMAADSGENHQDDTNSTGANTNSTGANPYMTFSAPTYRAGGYEARAQYPAPHHVVKPHVKK
jgi:hypothetical protein